MSPPGRAKGEGNPVSEAFVYVSNAEDGAIGTYALHDDGRLDVGPRCEVAAMLGPLAVDAGKGRLFAASRAKPFSLHSLAIDPATGALTPRSQARAADSFPYLFVDATGRWLLAASYAGGVVSVNAIDDAGRLSDPTQVVPVGRNAHSIRADRSNRFVFVPALGTDQIFQFTFDATTGRLTSNTPAIVPVAPGTGPRHVVVSADNRFVYVVSEFLATVTTFALDAATGLLTEVGSIVALSPESTLVAGAARGAPAAGGAPRDTSNDVWAADLHLTPDGRFLYVSERTRSTLEALAVDPSTGALAYLRSTPTERQPRGFRIDPTGRYLIAAGEKSPTITVYAIDAADGGLSVLGQYPGGRGANWVEIVATRASR